MKYKSKNIIKLLKIIVIIMYLLGTAVVAFYSVENQPVTIAIDTKSELIEKSYSAAEITSMNDIEVLNAVIDDTQIKEIRFYRRLKTVCIEKITADKLLEYIEVENNIIIFNEKAVKLLTNVSHSYFLERLIFMECLFALMLLSWIIINAIDEKINPQNKSNHGPLREIKRFILDIKKYGQFMIFAAKADLKAEVANSYLNRLWWLLEPFFNMLVYVIVFGKIMGNSVENYATFVFSALLMWNFFSKTINYSVKCVRNNRDIVTKVYVPKHVLLISNMFLNFFKLLFSLIVLIPMLIIFHVNIGINALWLLMAYALMLLFSFGIGMFLLHYGVYIDDLGYAVGILLQMMMFLSGVFYDVVTGLTSPLNTMMLALNPVAMFIDTMRNALLYNVVSNVPLIAIWIILSFLISYMGIHLVYKNENGYVKVV